MGVAHQACGKVQLNVDEKAKCRWDDAVAVLRLSISQVNERRELLRCWCASCLLLTCHLCWAANCLLYFWIRFLACHCFLFSESSIMISMAAQATHARKVCKLCVNPYISIINSLRTDIQAQPQTKTPHLQNYESHAKAFSNYICTLLALFQCPSSLQREKIHHVSNINVRWWVYFKLSCLNSR